MLCPSASLRVRAVTLLGDAFAGAIPRLSLAGSEAADLRGHILLRLQRLCQVPEPELAQVAKATLVRALRHSDTEPDDGPEGTSHDPAGTTQGCWPSRRAATSPKIRKTVAG